MFDYKLALATGVDFPLPELQIVIHQPSIKEISMIGESDFFFGIQILCLNKAMYADQSNIPLDQINNFQIFIGLINDPQMADKKAKVQSVFALLFPRNKVLVTPRSILVNQAEGNIIIDEGNFEILQKVLQEMFCLSKTDQGTFNPVNDKAKEIADKLMKARQKIAQEKAKETGSGSTLGQYLSIITVGLGSMSLKESAELTMYQLYDLVERYSLYTQWDLDAKCRLAGGKPDKPAENWMKNIH